ncbi:hypothetical protein OG331_50335 [Streptomyces sp. NBC_01017]|uniref:hypothetical protein n=1 Tax=Streptomyces sp. NBC_01017 TaxID=2903721 RepID=UPI00386F5B89|nr:hypothetical protein OG331_01640 [Streptomyces sp. NBC_01017]WSV35141.1 hypothetical protein OG331_50335 [Streptomyces sp. NBC_01017]
MTQAQRRGAGFTTVRFHRNATALFLAGSLMGLAGCSDSDPKASPSAPSQRPTATPTASPNSTADAEEAAVLAAYTQSWKAQAEAYAKASSAGTGLRKTTTLRALGLIEKDLTTMRKAGQVTTGKPAIHPRDPKVTDGDIPKATLTDCVDTTNWTLIDKASKKKVPLPSTRLVKYISTAKLEKWGAKWMVTELTAQAQSC